MVISLRYVNASIRGTGGTNVVHIPRIKSIRTGLCLDYYNQILCDMILESTIGSTAKTKMFDFTRV